MDKTKLIRMEHAAELARARQLMWKYVAEYAELSGEYTQDAIDNFRKHEADAKETRAIVLSALDVLKRIENVISAE